MSLRPFCQAMSGVALSSTSDDIGAAPKPRLSATARIPAKMDLAVAGLVSVHPAETNAAAIWSCEPTNITFTRSDGRFELRVYARNGIFAVNSSRSSRSSRLNAWDEELADVDGVETSGSVSASVNSEPAG